MPPPPTITIEKIIQDAIDSLNDWTDTISKIIEDENNGIRL